MENHVALNGIFLWGTNSRSLMRICSSNHIYLVRVENGRLYYTYYRGTDEVELTALPNVLIMTQSGKIMTMPVAAP